MSDHQLSVLPTHHHHASSSSVALPTRPPSEAPSTTAPTAPSTVPSIAQTTSHAPSLTPSITASHTASAGSQQPSVMDHDPIPPSGYPKLAVQMGLMPEVAIFRRFGFLNAQNILYMQAELVCLEERLRKLQVKDDKAPEPKSRYAKNWWMLSESADDGDDEQWRLVQEIRGKLKEYNKALIQQIKIVSTDPPSPYDLRYIQRYLESPDMEDGFLSGKDADLWGSIDAPSDHALDLLSLLPRHNEDFFSRWATESAVNKLLRLNQERTPAYMAAAKKSSTARRNNLVGFKDNTVLRWTFVVASVLGSALPILSIAILYCVQSLKVRLGLIAVFNLLLSFSLAAFTSAKRADIFAVSAAFSAVQVVFVQVGINGTESVSN